MKGGIGLQTIVIDYFFHNIFDLKKKISLALDFRTFLENMNMSSSLSKILKTGINVFKRNSQIMKNTKYYDISTIYDCAEK